MKGAARLITLSVALLATALVASRAETAVSIAEFPLPTADSFPLWIAAGPDGNLWFTEYCFFDKCGPNNIGRITTDGVITEFSIPTAGSAPFAIAAGPDGNLWFTESVGNIGRITPAGDVTEFPLPASSVPLGICLGPDGALWFAENGANKIGRITPAGDITEFVLPAGVRPWTIASGPDGNLWFTELMGLNIGRITMDGVITEFPIPTPGMAGREAYWIAAGPDGALWFTENGNPSKIGRITTSGVITELTFPTASSFSEGICLGPGGDLWFAEFLGNNIGRISFGRSYYTLPPCRVLDTRDQTGQLGGPPLQSGATRTFDVSASPCGIPADAIAISANLTVTNVGASGELVVFPTDVPMPDTSAMSFRAGVTRANNAMVTLSGSGTTFSVFNKSTATVDFIVDVSGFFR
jgi:virginiamycin B lyase